MIIIQCYLNKKRRDFPPRVQLSNVSFEVYINLAEMYKCERCFILKFEFWDLAIEYRSDPHFGKVNYEDTIELKVNPK